MGKNAKSQVTIFSDELHFEVISRPRSGAAITATVCATSQNIFLVPRKSRKQIHQVDCTAGLKCAERALHPGILRMWLKPTASKIWHLARCAINIRRHQ